jgi:hypothetical protein
MMEDDAVFMEDDKPEMFEILGITRLRDRKDYSQYDRDKIVEYCLDRDVEVIRARTGGFGKKNDEYIRLQRKSELQQDIERVSTCKADGDFAGVSKNTYDISWRATTVPYGFARQAREHESLLGTYI